MSEIKKGRYRHYKGKDYLVIGEGYHHETREPMVLYVPLYGEFRIEIRPKDMFLFGRFLILCVVYRILPAYAENVAIVYKDPKRGAER